MKQRLIILTVSTLLFSSCIVKSLQPFYIKNTIKYNKTLVGKWTDNRKGSWEIESFKTKWKEDEKNNETISEDDKKEYERYKDAYYIKYTKKETTALFIAMPFEVDQHLFIDLTPITFDNDNLSELAAQHLLKTHSAAYVKIDDDHSITLKWLSEKTIKHLVNSQKLRIKNEKTGVNEDLVLTATSDELHEFLKKFMKNNFKEKWDNDDIYTLTPNNAKP